MTDDSIHAECHFRIQKQRERIRELEAENRKLLDIDKAVLFETNHILELEAILSDIVNYTDLSSWAQRLRERVDAALSENRSG